MVIDNNKDILPWIYHIRKFPKDDGSECPYCHEELFGIVDYKYCPYCGNKVKKEQ